MWIDGKQLLQNVRSVSRYRRMCMRHSKVLGTESRLLWNLLHRQPFNLICNPFDLGTALHPATVYQYFTCLQQAGVN